MKTKWTRLACGLGVLLLCAGYSEAGPSLPVTKPPVLTGLLTGPYPDIGAIQGQYFVDTNFMVQTVRSNEFYDEAMGGPAGANAITGYVDSITYLAGPGSPITAFTIFATIQNDALAGGTWTNGSNRHGETMTNQVTPYVGPLVDTRLVAEFAVRSITNVPATNNAYYVNRQPYIEAVSEDQWAWYCWNPSDIDPTHTPSGDYFVPAWDFGTIPFGQSATRKLSFVVAPPYLQPVGDIRYPAIVSSFAFTNDVLMNRTLSLKISTWIEEIALDGGLQHEEEPPARLSDVSVFHNRLDEEESTLDFGDAPDSPTGAGPFYATLLANNGARHVVVPGFHMGAAIDAETDGQPDATATGDDLANLDDEDGVAFATALFPGVQNQVRVVAAVPAGTSAYVSVWIDLNGDGDWADTGEKVVWDNGASSGTQWYPFTPGPIAAASSTFVRVRMSSQQNLNYDGLAPDGEVEDCEIPIVPVKWLQPPDLSTNGVDVDNATVQLADDFRCSQTGPITDFHVWTSFRNDELPPEGLTNVAFTLYLYKDVPAQVPENPFSHPGALVWSREFPAGSYAAGRISAGTSEWWHDPLQNTWVFPGDSQVYQYDFAVPEEEAYIQATGTVYWLELKYNELQPGGFQLGWKTSTNHWNDDACWLDPDGLIWHELRYAGEHPLAPASMDLAFAVTGVEGEETLDFGDAPDRPYPTLLINDGARHVVVPGIYMGALIDVEADGQPDVAATGDDKANLDDEDGVTFLNNWVVGQVATVQVVASASGIVSAWVDFDANGYWGDFGENVLAGSPVVAGINVMTVNVPASSSNGSTFARFRYTTLPVAMTFTGLVANGEVEDYALTILDEEETPLDFGDANDSPLVVGYPTLLANNGARHAIVPGVYMGALVDAEADGQPDGTATGDDNNPPTGLDDEDGVTIQSPLVAGSVAGVQVTASVPGYLNAWIDYNCNGTWIDPGEQVFLNQPLVPGPQWLQLPLPVPPAIVSGGPQSRWRFTTYPPAAPAFTGAESNGEVEDYEVRIEVLDFGDAPDPTYPTIYANDGARHLIPATPVVYLGATAPDLSADGQPTAAADGDDASGVDDEDGVFAVAGAPLVRGDPSAALGVVCSTNGYLNGWLDFDADGSWTGAGEQIAVDRALPAGFSALVFGIPAGARLGPVVGRFRFASGAGLTYTGLASDGEVEDHEFTIYQNGPDTNNFRITNVAHSAANQMTIWWVGDTNVVYETQYILDLPSTASPPWTAWGPWVSAPPLAQFDTNAAETTKHYRVVAPYSPPP